MKIEIPREIERIGLVEIYGLQKIYELEGSMGLFGREGVIENIPTEVLYDRMREMAIIVPVKNENLKLIEGVLVGIPNTCQIIIVSNSDRGPVDKFAIEKNAIKNYARFANKKILIVHQKDLGVSRSFQNAQYNTILDENGIVKSGKAEGMIIGTLMAKWLGKKYLGFVDSDNYFPGSVLEYIKEYAAGFSINNENNVLVRISWHSKPE